MTGRGWRLMRALHDYSKFLHLKNKSGIYKFSNINNSKVYIGRSKNIYQRIGEHFRNSQNKNNSNYHCHFYNALRKYPYEDWIVECIYETDSISEMVEKEKFYIQQFDSVNNGYNSIYETDSPEIKTGGRQCKFIINKSRCL